MTKRTCVYTKGAVNLDDAATAAPRHVCLSARQIANKLPCVRTDCHYNKLHVPALAVVTVCVTADNHIGPIAGSRCYTMFCHTSEVTAGA